ncbi:hypothetical protein K503DRAFT_814146, partial [Rhizopogon vinicolor AM-OR11-026]
MACSQLRNLEIVRICTNSLKRRLSGLDNPTSVGNCIDGVWHINSPQLKRAPRRIHYQTRNQRSCQARFMTEHNTPKKKRLFGWLKHSHSDHRLPQNQAASANEPSSGPASPRPRPQRLICKLWGKVFKKDSTIGTQLLNPAPLANSPDRQDISPAQTDQTPSPLIAPTPEANSDQVPDLPAANLVTKSLENAHKSLSGASHVPDLLQNTASATANADSVLHPIDTFSNCLTPLKVHPYAKVALSILTSASQMILDQADRDDAVSSLLSKVSEVFAFMTEEEELARITSMLAIYGKIARQTLECADFITHYSETKSGWARLGKHV